MLCRVSPPGGAVSRAKTARGDGLVKLARAVGRDVAEVNDQVGRRRLDPARDYAPVVCKRRRPRSEVSVRDEDDPHTRMLPASMWLAREGPAPTTARS